MRDRRCPTRSTRSTISSTSVIASTGVASMMTMLVAYIDQTNSGRRNQVRPGARMRWMVTRKLRPVRIDEKPVMNAPSVVRKTFVFEYCVENGV